LNGGKKWKQKHPREVVLPARTSNRLHAQKVLETENQKNRLRRGRGGETQRKNRRGRRRTLSISFDAVGPLGEKLFGTEGRGSGGRKTVQSMANPPRDRPDAPLHIPRAGHLGAGKRKKGVPQRRENSVEVKKDSKRPKILVCSPG